MVARVTGAVLLFASFTVIAPAAWFAAGPFGGAAEVVRVASPNLVLAAAQNGLIYQSTNGGASWQHREFPGQLAGTLHVLEVDPHAAGTWYIGMEAGANRGGLYKTEDGGQSWKQLPALVGKSVWSLALWPADSTVLAAGTGDGVYLSADGGATWRRISPESNTELRPVVSLAFHPKDRNIIYAGTTHLPWRTRDGGANWESIHTGMIDDSDVFSIAVERETPATVFASACSGVYRSSDAGSNWKRLSTPAGAFRTYLVSPDPRQPGVVFAATSAGLLRSVNNGAVWTKVSPYAVKSIAYMPGRDGKIFFASANAGILISRDGGKTLAEFNSGYANRNFAAVAAAGDVIYASSVYEPGSGGIFRTDNRGLTWRRLSPLSGGENAVQLAAAPPDGSTVFAAAFRDVYSSTDAGKTWTSLGTPPGASHIAALEAIAGGTVLAGTDAGLFRKARGGAWTPVALGSTARIEKLQRTGGNRVTAVSVAAAYVSSDNGTSFRACAQPAAGAVWYGLAFDSAPEAAALAATSVGLFRSVDQCASWVPVAALDRATVTQVLFHPVHAGEVFAARYGTILRSIDAGLTWQALDDEGRNGAYPAALLILPAAPQRLFALFPRRGVGSISFDPRVTARPWEQPGAGAPVVQRTVQ